MLCPYSERGDFPAVLFFPHRKFSASGLFYRLENNRPCRLISLMPGILIQPAGIRERIHCIRYFFIMRLSASALADKKNQTASRCNSRLFDGVFLFLSAAILLLLTGLTGRGIDHEWPEEIPAFFYVYLSDTRVIKFAYPVFFDYLYTFIIR
jgi:hypothetical protein